jgi:hypothetical protein
MATEGQRGKLGRALGAGRRVMSGTRQTIPLKELYFRLELPSPVRAFRPCPSGHS